MSARDRLSRFVVISEIATVPEKIGLSATFMALVGQIEVMKWLAGWEIEVHTDLLTYVLTLTFFVAIWGMSGPTMRDFTRFCGAAMIWNVALDFSRMAYLHVVGVLLLQVKPETVLP